MNKKTLQGNCVSGAGLKKWGKGRRNFEKICQRLAGYRTFVVFGSAYSGLAYGYFKNGDVGAGRGVLHE